MALGGIGGFFKNLFVGPDTPSEPQASKNLAEFSKKQFENIFPILQQAAPQLAQILQGGTAQAQLPNIMQAITAARSALSGTLNQTGENLSRTGITGGQAQRILADTSRQGNMAISQIPFDFTNPIIAAIFQTLLGQPALAAQGLGTAGQIGAGINTASSQAANLSSQQAGDLISGLGLFGLFGGFGGGGSLQGKTVFS